MNTTKNNNSSGLGISDVILRELFTQIDIQIMVTDLETDEIIYANDKMNAAYNVDYDPTGKRCWEAYQKNKRGRCDFCPLRQASKGTSWSVEWESFNEATGRWFRNKSNIIHWTDGRLVHLEQGTDVTNVMRTNDALREAESYTQMMLDSTPLSCAVWDEKGNLLDTNKESLRLFGLQEKSEYINGFYSLSPEYQTDGEPSAQKVKRVLSRALETGFAQFNWDFKTKEEKCFLTEVTLIRVPYKNEFRILSYTRDIRETSEIKMATEHHMNLLHTTGNIAVALMDTTPETFDKVLVDQLKDLCEAVGVNRATIWENYDKDGEIWHRQIYRWAFDESWYKNFLPLYSAENYNSLPDHKRRLFSQETINRRCADMEEEERKYFTKLGLKALLMVPIMTNNELWGFICFDNCADDVLTPEIEVSALRSTGIMIAAAIMRNRAKAELIANDHELKMNGTLLAAVNHVAATLLANDPSKLLANDFSSLGLALRECEKTLGESVGAHRVSVWRNFEGDDGRLRSRRLSGWAEGVLDDRSADELEIDFSTYIPEWDKGVRVRRDINMPLSQMSAAIRDSELLRDSKSLLMVQIEMKGEFWGFIAYSFETDNRQIDKAEIDILRSGGTMIASSIIQNEVSMKLVVTDEALAAIRAKNEFMARMSHEIRTPMNAIIGMTSIAQQSTKADEVQDALEVVAASSLQLMNIINNILDMSAINAGDRSVANKPYSFDHLLENNFVALMQQIEEKKQHIHYDFINVLDRMIVGDEEYTAKIISNLFSNAIKFTPVGGEIALRVVGSETLLTIEVIDSGSGIRKEYLPKIFDLFEQEDGSITRQFGGIGLGLPLTKGLVSLMGGTISVKNNEGKGCCFSVELPVVWGEPCTPTLQPSAQEDVPRQDKDGAVSDWHDKCVLLVEDMQVNRMVAMSLMSDTGVTIECAENGKQAVEMAAVNIDTYDLIFMDLQMPVMDGLEATRQIRALDNPKAKTIPIYAMTANATTDDIAACMEVGMNGCVPKPIDTDLLHKTMDEAFFGIEVSEG